MEQRINKTIMCSVLFLDIVAYSKKSVSAQIAQKELFNTLLAKAIRLTPVNDRIILDTGDGAAVAFLGDIEDALKAVLDFRQSLQNEGVNVEPPLEVCMSINLGPVRMVKDINGQPNIVGDGINVAQRIMSFAEPGQILVSRSYFDAASRLKIEYGSLFHFQGSRTDKHVRAHDVYAVGQPGAAIAQPVPENSAERNRAPGLNGWLTKVGILSLFKQASVQQLALYAGIAVSALVLLIVVTLKIAHRLDEPESQAEFAAKALPDAAPAVIAASAVIPVTSAAKVATGETGAKGSASSVMNNPAAKKSKAAGSPAELKAVSVIHAQPETLSKDAAAKKPVPAKPSAMADVSFAVTPWGEVYVDGIIQGVSPPLDLLHVQPGKHEVQIRNTTFPPFTLSIDVKSDEKMKIKHKFAN